mmetsp:Transcript_15165/g.12914  ORF Transcript_15165/g.12914 Transcript_15165/m.12914 type:complete len:88 (-) Transcript_15165:292-555(-)
MASKKEKCFQAILILLLLGMVIFIGITGDTFCTGDRECPEDCGLIATRVKNDDGAIHCPFTEDIVGVVVTGWIIMFLVTMMSFIQSI